MSESEDPSEKEDTPDLSFVTMDELINELRKRTKAFIAIVVLKSESDEESSAIRHYFQGGAYAALGLAHRFAHWINKEMDISYEESDIDEEETEEE